MSKKDWLVYVLRCADGSYYTGCTNNLTQRIRSHNNQNGAKYTRGRTPVKVVYCEKNLSHSKALQREYEIKQMSREEKIKLVKAECQT